MNGLLGWLQGSWKSLIYLHFKPFVSARTDAPSLFPGPVRATLARLVLWMVAVGLPVSRPSVLACLRDCVLPSKHFWGGRGVLSLCLCECVHIRACESGDVGMPGLLYTYLQT